MPRGIYKRKPFSDKHKENISRALKGRTHSKEHISKLPQNQKGYMSGEKHPRSLITNIQVLEIRQLLNSGKTNKKVAEMYNLTQGHISRIKTFRAYRDVV